MNTQTIAAQKLSGTCIGSRVKFAAPYRAGSPLLVSVTACVREVHHADGETTLYVSADGDFNDLVEFALDPRAPVTLLDTGAREEAAAAMAAAAVPPPPHTRDTVVAGRSYRIGPDPTWHGVGGVCSHEGIPRDEGGLRTGDIVEVRSVHPDDPDVQVRFADPETGARHRTYVNPACLDLHPVTTRDDLVAGREYRIVRQPYWWPVDGTRVGYDWSAFPTVVTVVGLRSDVPEGVSRHDPDVAVSGSAFAAGTYLDPECLDPVPVDA